MQPWSESERVATKFSDTMKSIVKERWNIVPRSHHQGEGCVHFPKRREWASCPYQVQTSLALVYTPLPGFCYSIDDSEGPTGGSLHFIPQQRLLVLYVYRNHRALRFPVPVTWELLRSMPQMRKTVLRSSRQKPTASDRAFRCRATEVSTRLP